MIAVLSPAKKLDLEALPRSLPRTQPLLLSETKHLLPFAKQLSAADLQALMKLSPALAQLNYERFQKFSAKTPAGSKQAAFTFNGDTYAGLKAWDMDLDDCQFAQQHLLILSGLYGLLRPLDVIQPYRLEMGVKLASDRGSNLYQFWGKRLSERINRLAAKQACPALVNLASNEYFTAIDRTSLRLPVVTCVFKEGTGDTGKVIGFSAKRARGMMARFIVKNRLTKPEELKDFNDSGYRFVKGASAPDTLVFARPR